MICLFPLLLALLPQTQAAAAEPASAGGTWVVFSSSRGGNYASSIHAVRPDGTGEHRLSRHPSGLPNCIDPRVSPDGQRIIFGRGAGGAHRTGVGDMRMDGSDERQLSGKVMVRFNGGRLSPSISNDGKRIAYAGEVSGKRWIHVADEDGADPRRLCEGQHPWWSPVDDHIAFIAQHEGTDQIWIVGADGGEPVRLTEGDETGYPSWSPDAQRILFSRQVGESVDLYTVNRDGTHLERVTDTPGRSEIQATMSPDGKWIAFVARVPDSPLGWERSVYLMPAGGGEAKQLTQTKYDDKMPTWLVK